MININKQTIQMGSLGNSAYAKLMNDKKKEIIQIIFTKGKLELELQTVERINIYDTAMNIFFKDNTSKFINLMNVTYME